MRPESQAVEAPNFRREVEIEEDNCVVCGRCEEACPQDSIEVNGVIEITSDDCSFCALCENICPTDAISINSEDGVIEIYGASCLRCGACENVCPTNSISMACLDCLEPHRETDKLEETCDFRFEGSVSFDDDGCVYCGRCESVCPTGSIEVRSPFEGNISLQNEDCNESCWDCIELCPTDSLERLDGDLVIDRDTCIYCGACQQVCSSEAISFEREMVDVVDNRGKLALRVD